MKNDKLSLNRWIAEAEEKGQSLQEFLIEYNTRQLECDRAQLLDKMKEMLRVMRKSIESGLTGVRSHSGLTGGDARKLQQAKSCGLLGEKARDAVIFAMAVGECNAAMGRIVAAPTAGASGVLPGVFFALEKHYNLSEETLAEGLVVAGSIGLVIADRASLAGATGGCQAECGSAAAMAAGAAVTMLGGHALAGRNGSGHCFQKYPGTGMRPGCRTGRGALHQTQRLLRLAGAGSGRACSLRHRQLYTGGRGNRRHEERRRRLALRPQGDCGRRHGCNAYGAGLG